MAPTTQPPTQRRPRIGITTVPHDGRQTVPETYIRAIEQAGGLPLIVPRSTDAGVITTTAALLDGLVIPGGDGVTQGLIGSLPDDLPPESPTRWQSDSAYYAAMAERARPVLGICYGMQLINALNGGTIYADVQAQRPDTLPHTSRRGRDSHTLQVVPDTLLASIIGEQPVTVNSYHVQAVAEVGPELRINAYSDDGLIEGIESPDGRLLGMQCHPERLTGQPWTDLFVHFIQRCLDR